MPLSPCVFVVATPDRSPSAASVRAHYAFICNECVGLCADVMQAEPGGDWR